MEKLRPTSNSLLLALVMVAITAIGTGLRFYAANRLPIDSDERVYLQSALSYNNFIRQGQWGMLARNDFNSEHPAFYKIVYGFALLTQPPLEKIEKRDFVLGKSIAKVQAKPWGLAGRYVSVICGGLTTLALSAINPLAGLFFATDTLAVKYTSTMFLEALPALANLLAVLCYLKWYRSIRSPSIREDWLWLFLSAGFLGVSVASKYTYVVVGIAIAIHLIGSVILNKVPAKAIWKLAFFGILAMAAFFACDLYLWKHTIPRLLGTFAFHLDHRRQGTLVWQPLVWFSAPFPYFFENSRLSFLVSPDTLIGVLALAGLPRLFHRQPFYFIWLGTGLAMLLLWPNKWPQYNMIVMAPVCLSAAMGTGWLFDLLKVRLVSWHKRTQNVTTMQEPG